MDILNQILGGLNSIPAEVWSEVINVIVSAIIVSPLALGLKKWWNINGEKVMMFMVIFGSMAASAVVYLQSQTEFSPWVIAVQGALTFAATQPVYYLFVKPLWRQVSGWFASQVAEAAALNDTKSAALPDSGLPIGSTNEQNKNT